MTNISRDKNIYISAAAVDKTFELQNKTRDTILKPVESNSITLVYPGPSADSTCLRTLSWVPQTGAITLHTVKDTHCKNTYMYYTRATTTKYSVFL